MSDKLYTQGEYFKKNTTWHVQDSPWKASQIFKIIKQNRLEPKSICEVGCGAGEILRQLSNYMPNDVIFTGYEISPQAFELCKQRANERIRFYLKEISRDHNSFFDLILAIDVVEHIEDCFGFLRGLREKGKFKIFLFPLDLFVLSVLWSIPIIKARQDVGHIHYFTKETALALLKDTGYKILDYFYTDGPIKLYPRSLLGKVSRKLLYKINKDICVRILGGYSILILTQ